MALKIALAGNPNCGKTTLFNALTGANQFVSNWPGVTVEKKEGKLKGHKEYRQGHKAFGLYVRVRIDGGTDGERRGCVPYACYNNAERFVHHAHR